MTDTKRGVKPQPLTLTQELILMLLNEETGYFHQVPGWDLNCAVVGAVLAELSLRSRIDTDMESLFLLDATKTGNPSIDPILDEIASDTNRHNTRYWIEHLAPRAETIIDSVLDRLVEMSILEHHDGEFWTLARTDWKMELYSDVETSTASQFVRTRISRAIFMNEIPDPRDVIVISLINTCDVFRFMFQLDEETEARIQAICQMDLIGRSITEAVSHNLAGPTLRRPAFVKKIPTVSLSKLLLNRHIRDGNLNALFGNLAQEYGPVFKVHPPFAQPMTFLAGLEANRWVHKHGRMYLRARDYFSEFEKVYGASGLLPSLDGADHFRLRKNLSPAYSRGRLGGQLEKLYDQARSYMASWNVGESYSATTMCRRMINAQLSPLFIGVDTQDVMDDLMKFKERALSVHVARILPKFMLNTPGMKRRAKTLDTLMERIEKVHTPAQRAECPRDLVDDYLSLHASDPQFLPESNLRFAFSAALIASVYLGDTFSLVVYAMASRPALYEKIRNEADAIFANGDPDVEAFTPSAMDVTHRFLMECMRMYPIVPMSIRNVMNTFVFEGYELPLGERLHIAPTATHYMSDVFPDPYTFDIDRYLPSRNEHRSPGYAPYGLGTHMCLGTRWMELQLAVNLLMLTHYFRIEMSPANYKLRFNPFPSLKPSKKLKFVISEQRRELQV
ncbi:MAG: cytochrome P450 [Gemmatimonadetes bacterium]|nr:cytochrome P450 [Gemmatimonadota bacterium]MYG86810.1 cytochrome P450 [Gemmatimonadota bacterium]MYJ88423.1 cytochrome P450 [Gemmatimonadota bacterium]